MGEVWVCGRCLKIKLGATLGRIHLRGGCPHSFLAQAAASLVVGGTTSVLAGGKFANGAVTASFQLAFNHAKRWWESMAEGIAHAPMAGGSMTTSPLRNLGMEQMKTPEQREQWLCGQVAFIEGLISLAPGVGLAYSLATDAGPEDITEGAVITTATALSKLGGNYDQRATELIDKGRRRGFNSPKERRAIQSARQDVRTMKVVGSGLSKLATGVGLLGFGLTVDSLVGDLEQCQK